MSKEVKTATASNKTAGGFSALLSAISIVIALIIGIIIYKFILGNPANFIDNNPEGEPLKGNFLGVVYKGGVIVPVLIAVNLIVIIFMFERFLTLAKIKGQGKLDAFIEKVKHLLANGNVDAALTECNKQKGSLANVVRAGLLKYKLLQDDTSLDKEKKIEAVKQELEEAITLEGPMMSKNLVILSTIASVSVLIGLVGTVLGMIRAFAAMSHGTPDTAQLATGISEALINTALGIFGSLIAIIFYNLFSTKVDQMTHAMDEASFTIVQDFSKSVR
ncbi:MAG: MotA/TolQ/ExbB proton channel family protein [Flavobacteriia bacterium]|nr:MotA/TolQ/ExbB proton channel family protein [Flavobacteriia bacterium]OJX39811.1 MAG: flagellar motor protein MotA [Flavobacteriia bacterium 40-80]